MPKVNLQLVQGAGRPNFDATIGINKGSNPINNQAGLISALLHGGSVVTTTFNVKTQYGASGNGTDDDSLHIRDAFNAAHTHARNGAHATVYFPPGIYRINTIWTMPPIRTNDWYENSTPTVNRSGTIKLSGYNATIKYDPVVAPATRTQRFTFLMAPNPGGNWVTYGNLEIEGFAFDNGLRIPQADCGTIIWVQGNQTNIDNITIKDCTTFNYKRRTVTIENGSSKGVFLHSAQVNRAQAHTSYITNITIDGCNIQGQGKPITILCPATGESVLGLNKVIVDNVWVNNTATDVCHFTGTGIHLGSYASGYRCRVTNCSATDSCDNLIEIDAFNEVEVSNCTMSDAPSGIGFTWFSYPYKTDMPQYTIDNCHYTGGHNSYWPPNESYHDIYNTRSTSAFGSVTLGDADVELVGRKWGDFSITNCTSIQGGYDITNSYSPIYLEGPMNSVTLNNIDFTDTDTSPVTPTIEIYQSPAGGTLPISIHDCRRSTGGAFSLLTSSQVYLQGSRTVTTDISGLT